MKTTCYLQDARTERSCFACIDPSGAEPSVLKWMSVDLDRERRERGAFNKFRLCFPVQQNPGMLFPYQAWYRVGLVANYICLTDNGRFKGSQRRQVASGSGSGVDPPGDHVSTSGTEVDTEVAGSFHQLSNLAKLRMLNKLAVHFMPQTLARRASRQANEMSNLAQAAADEWNENNHDHGHAQQPQRATVDRPHSIAAASEDTPPVDNTRLEAGKNSAESGRANPKKGMELTVPATSQQAPDVRKVNEYELPVHLSWFIPWNAIHVCM